MKLTLERARGFWGESGLALSDWAQWSWRWGRDGDGVVRCENAGVAMPREFFGL